MSSTLDAIKARYSSIPEKRLAALQPGMQTLLRSDVPALIALAETVCNYMEFVKSPAPINQGHVFLDEMANWVRVLRQRKDQPRGVPVVKLQVLSD